MTRSLPQNHPAWRQKGKWIRHDVLWVKHLWLEDPLWAHGQGVCPMPGHELKSKPLDGPLNTHVVGVGSRAGGMSNTHQCSHPSMSPSVMMTPVMADPLAPLSVHPTAAGGQAAQAQITSSADWATQEQESGHLSLAAMTPFCPHHGILPSMGLQHTSGMMHGGMIHGAESKKGRGQKFVGCSCGSGPYSDHYSDGQDTHYAPHQAHDRADHQANHPCAGQQGSPSACLSTEATRHGMSCLLGNHGLLTGLIVKKKTCALAVHRHRIKRRLRHAIADSWRYHTSAWHAANACIVMVQNASVAQLDFQRLIRLLTPKSSLSL